MGPGRWRVGVDVGGTFTDLAVLDASSGALGIYKVPTTPQDPSIGVMNGMRFVGEQTPGGFDVSQIQQFLHGTTITTNALIQRTYAPCALLITEGLRGTLQVRDRPRDASIYDLKVGTVESIVDELNVFEVPERTDRAGNIVRPIDTDAVVAIANKINEYGIKSVAVCLMFSFTNPSHEEQTRVILAERCKGVRVSLSSDVLPRIREWPRISTMLLNASLGPLLVDYVQNLADALQGEGLSFDRLFLMESNGGLMPFSAVINGGRAVQTLLSGPAAAVQGAVAVARAVERGTLVTLDIGGTSADIAFVDADGALEMTEGHLVGYDIYVPMLDVTTIGAGGGTISRLTQDGRLLVGPQSAGAVPGPVCYGRGGLEPTTTDADLVLGFLDPAYYLGGRMTIDAEAATAAITAKIAQPLGISVLEAASTMIQINDVHMADAIRVFAAQKGVDLATSTLVACGGAGPLHAAGVASEIGIRRILVPPHPGAFSAVGLLSTDVVQDFVQSEITALVPESEVAISKRFADLSAKAIDELVDQRFSPDEIVCHREVDARYSGQGFEIRLAVPVDSGRQLHQLLTELFHEGHRRTYGYIAEGEGVEIVSYRVRAVVELSKYGPQLLAERHMEVAAAVNLATSRTVYVGGAWHETPIIARDQVDENTHLEGPLVIEQSDTTTFVPPGWSLECDAYGNLIVSAAGA